MVKNHLAGSCKILQDLLLDLAYSTILQALARSCHLQSLRMSSIGLLENAKQVLKKSLFAEIYDLKVIDGKRLYGLQPGILSMKYLENHGPITYLKVLGFIFNLKYQN